MGGGVRLKRCYGGRDKNLLGLGVCVGEGERDAVGEDEADGVGVGLGATDGRM